MTESGDTSGPTAADLGAQATGSAGGQPEAGGQAAQAAQFGNPTATPFNKDAFTNLQPAEKAQILMQLNINDIRGIKDSLESKDQILADTILNIREVEAKAKADAEAMTDEKVEADGNYKPDNENVGMIDPDATDEMAGYNQFIDDEFAGKDEAYILANKEEYKRKLARYENRKDAAERLRAFNLSEEAIKQLVEDIPDPEPEGVPPELPDEVESRGVAGSESLAAMDKESKALATEFANDETFSKRIQAHNVKIAALSKRFKGFFAEGEPGRKYARIGGKLVYFALLAAFIAIILEMNIINKAAGNRRGGR